MLSTLSKTKRLKNMIILAVMDAICIAGSFFAAL